MQASSWPDGILEYAKQAVGAENIPDGDLPRYKEIAQRIFVAASERGLEKSELWYGHNIIVIKNKKYM
jgi:hypothetical protein